VQADEDAPYCLDTRFQPSDGEYPLVCYELHSKNVGHMAKTFGEWFVQWLQQRVE